MAISIGEILDVTVIKTTKFGAFVKAQDGTEGLVHISELTHGFVNAVEDIVKVGDEVKVKVLSEKDGKISMSIKETMEKPNFKNKKKDLFKKEEVKQPTNPKDMSFEDKLSLFIKQSNENLQQARTRENKRGNNRRRNNNS